MVVMFVVVTALAVGYERVRSSRDASADARRDASFAAELAASHIERDLDAVRSTLSRLAANPQVAGLFASDSSCVLQFSGSGVFTGHLDFVALDGRVACSSLTRPATDDYRGQPWVADSLDGEIHSVPMLDSRTGRQVVVVTAPIPGLGHAAAFLDLDALGPGLLSTFGGPLALEFLVATGDGRRRSHSVDRHGALGGDRLVGHSVRRLPLGAPSHDVDGRARIYASAPVGTGGWVVYAGANRSQAVAAAQPPTAAIWPLGRPSFWS